MGHGSKLCTAARGTRRTRHLKGPGRWPLPMVDSDSGALPASQLELLVVRQTTTNTQDGKVRTCTIARAAPSVRRPESSSGVSKRPLRLRVHQRPPVSRSRPQAACQRGLQRLLTRTKQLERKRKETETNTTISAFGARSQLVITAVLTHT